MKRIQSFVWITTFSLLLLLVGRVTLAQATEPPFKIVVQEDFSLWTKGSESSPYGETEGGKSNNYLINPALMHQSGWRGNYVYQAGGVAYLKLTDDGVAGHIQTPEMALYGVVKLTFRAKILKGKQAKGQLWIALCDNTQGPIDNKDVDLTTEWQEYEMVSTQATFNEQNIFQLQPLDCDVLIDDLVIERQKTTLIPPKVLPPLNTSSTSFKARWEASPDARSYLCSIYYLDMPQDVVSPTTVVENFDGIKSDAQGRINTADANYPEGWTIDLSSHGTQDVIKSSGDYHSAPQALVFDAVNDSIVSPKTKAPITELSFWVKPTSVDQETNFNFTLLEVAVFSDGRWQAIANIPNTWMKKEGGFYRFDSDMLKEYNIEQVRFTLIQRNSVSFYVDDITYTYGSKPVPYYIVKDKELTDTEYEITSYDPSKEHYYYVQSKDGETLSAATYPTWVDGLVGVTPRVDMPSDVTERSFTANWEKLWNAGYYQFNCYKQLKYKSSQAAQTILHETFDKITVGSVEKPVTPDETVVRLAQEELTSTDWILQLPAYAKGKAGVKETAPYSTTAGLVVSPALFLQADGGAFEVSVKAQSSVAQDTLFVMIMQNYTDQSVNEYRRIPFPMQAGSVSSSVTFDSPQNLKTREGIRIGFMSARGKPFYIDEVTIQQNIRKGDTGYAPYQTTFPKEPTMSIAHNLEGQSFVYNVQAFRTRLYKNYTSEISDFMVVKNPLDNAVENLAQKDQTSLSVYVQEGGVVLTSTSDDTISLYSLSGSLLLRLQLAREVPSFVPLAEGYYLIQTSHGGYKVYVGR